MPGKKRKNWIILGSAAFVAYVFAASAPIGDETILRPAWLKPLEKTEGKVDGELIPFLTSTHLGYFNAAGDFPLVERRNERTAISPLLWANYAKTDESIKIFGRDGAPRCAVESRGYPYMADGRTFVVGVEQHSVAEIDENGKERWRRDFEAPITCADAASGMALFGLLDGTVELIGRNGELVFTFEPGGSRLPVIAAARISPDGERIALISGVDPQRFVLLSRSGQTYKVVHHEYLDKGFRRPVLAAFVDKGKYVVFEREKGLEVYDTASRKSAVLDIGGAILAFEDETDDKRFFLIADSGDYRELVGVALPAGVFMRAPYLGQEKYIARRGSRLYLGGDGTIAALDIDRR